MDPQRIVINHLIVILNEYIYGGELDVDDVEDIFNQSGVELNVVGNTYHIRQIHPNLTMLRDLANTNYNGFQALIDALTESRNPELRGGGNRGHKVAPQHDDFNFVGPEDNNEDPEDDQDEQIIKNRVGQLMQQVMLDFRMAGHGDPEANRFVGLRYLTALRDALHNQLGIRLIVREGNLFKDHAFRIMVDDPNSDYHFLDGTEYANYSEMTRDLGGRYRGGAIRQPVEQFETHTNDVQIHKHDPKGLLIQELMETRDPTKQRHIIVNYGIMLEHAGSKLKVVKVSHNAREFAYLVGNVYESTAHFLQDISRSSRQPRQLGRGQTGGAIDPAVLHRMNDLRNEIFGIIHGLLDPQMVRQTFNEHGINILLVGNQQIMTFPIPQNHPAVNPNLYLPRQAMRFMITGQNAMDTTDYMDKIDDVIQQRGEMG